MDSHQINVFIGVTVFVVVLMLVVLKPFLIEKSKEEAIKTGKNPNKTGKNGRERSALEIFIDVVEKVLIGIMVFLATIFIAGKVKDKFDKKN